MSSGFLSVLIHCSLTNLDAALSLGEELINLFLKDVIDANHNVNYFAALLIAYITHNFQASSLLHEIA